MNVTGKMKMRSMVESSGTCRRGHENDCIAAHEQHRDTPLCLPVDLLERLLVHLCRCHYFFHLKQKQNIDRDV